jgi:hypothetical protein
MRASFKSRLLSLSHCLLWSYSLLSAEIRCSINSQYSLLQPPHTYHRGILAVKVQPYPRLATAIFVDPYFSAGANCGGSSHGTFNCHHQDGREQTHNDPDYQGRGARADCRREEHIETRYYQPNPRQENKHTDCQKAAPDEYTSETAFYSFGLFIDFKQQGFRLVFNSTLDKVSGSTRNLR